MASIGGTLEIPETTVQGTGSYVIPANRYAELSANSSHAATGYGLNQSSPSVIFTAAGGSSANENKAKLVAGDSITTNSSVPTGTQSQNSGSVARLVRQTSGYHRVLVNGVPFCVSYARGSGSICAPNFNQSEVGTAHSGEVGWSVSLFRIPKANLPQGAAEGE